MAKPTLTVSSEFGTFKRQTARTYTHLVIVKGYRAELIEAARLAEIESATKEAARYRKVVADGHRAGDRHEWDRKNTADWIADGSFAAWATEAEARAARLAAIGPVTADGRGWSSHDGGEAWQAPVWGILGWCGRLDLARKLAAGNEASRFRSVVILDVATGQAVR